MMRLTIAAVAVAAQIVVATSLLRSQPPSIVLSIAAMPPLHGLPTVAGVNTLPVQEIEDQSLVYPTVTKR